MPQSNRNSLFDILLDITPASASQSSGDGLIIEVLGDSRVYGQGLYDHLTQAWPYLLAKALPAAVVHNRGVSSTTAENTRDDLINNVSNPSTKRFLVQTGRNDINQGIPLSTTLSKVADMVAYFDSPHYIILGVEYQDDASPDIALPSTVAATNAMNAAFAAAYPGHFLDLNPVYAANADPNNATDLTQVAAFITPRSLRLDGVHSNAAGHALVARAVLGMLDVLTLPGPFLDPRSLGYVFGSIADSTSQSRAATWQRKHHFIKGLDSDGTINIQGDDCGWIVDAAGLNRIGFFKRQGRYAGFERAKGAVLGFYVVNNSSDITATTGDLGVPLTRTLEGSFSDAGLNLNVALTVGGLICTIPGGGVIASLGANGAAGLFQIGYETTTGGAIELVSSPFGPMILRTQNNQDIQLTPNGTGGIRLTHWAQIGISAEADIPARGIAWSTDRANTLCVRDPSGTLKVVTLS